ncbi:Fatty-acid peroxygenase [Streptomyces sp. ADI91-18]|uniref:cytochrome P450 n=1 Tax=Streptomyces sp. ADI91-18 TaxID=1522755 RepID=UPI000F5534E2|nr:cytochrome P450 [Streptomyces sp. ADI91-18]RPK39709.1 Fatty-acid peroxygenase [Streptomyces sp. ADI91-18]
MSPFKNPVASWSDSTLGLISHGYAWLPNRMRAETGGTVRTRLLGRQTVALRGPEAVGFFYDEQHVVRTSALPDPVLDTLFGQGAVHTLDGDAHRARKAMFNALLRAPDAPAVLAGHVGWRWREAVAGWGRERVVLFDESARVLALAVCDWVGVPLTGPAAAELAHDCTAMVDGFATPGPRHLRARRARARREEALARTVLGVRERPEPELKSSALETLAWYRGQDGNPLDPRTAAVELLNIIRPTVAIAWFATFAAHAMHRWPHQRDLLRSESEKGYAEAFAHEVRRFYPFAPFVGGLAARDLNWRGEDITQGTLVLLDLYGQNHDPALWDHPYRFDPHRFTTGAESLDHLIAQGGGDPAGGHRCPGEDITVTALAVLATELAGLDFAVPDQDLTIPLSRMPTLPRSGFEMSLS